jgi:hypothetical protein
MHTFNPLVLVLAASATAMKIPPPDLPYTLGHGPIDTTAIAPTGGYGYGMTTTTKDIPAKPTPSHNTDEPGAYIPKPSDGVPYKGPEPYGAKPNTTTVDVPEPMPTPSGTPDDKPPYIPVVPVNSTNSPVEEMPMPTKPSSTTSSKWSNDTPFTPIPSYTPEKNQVEPMPYPKPNGTTLAMPQWTGTDTPDIPDETTKMSYTPIPTDTVPAPPDVPPVPVPSPSDAPGMPKPSYTPWTPTTNTTNPDMPVEKPTPSDNPTTLATLPATTDVAPIIPTPYAPWNSSTTDMDMPIGTGTPDMPKYPEKPVDMPTPSDNPTTLATLPATTDVVPIIPTPYAPWNSTTTDIDVPIGTGTPDTPPYNDSPDKPSATTNMPAMPSPTGSAYGTGSSDKKTMILDVIYDSANETTNWLFFTSSSNSSKPATMDKCRKSSPIDMLKGSMQVGKFPAKHDGPKDSYADVWPGGDFKVKPYGKSCQYMNNGTNPGGLWCDGKKLDCLRYPGSEMASKKPIDCGKGRKQMPVITCQWHEEMRVPGNVTTKHWMSNKHNATHFMLEY